MFELSKIAGLLLSPLTWVLTFWLASAVCILVQRKRWAVGLASTGFATLWVASLPVVAETLAAPLEDKYPARSAQTAPSADAILVLGGALSGARPPRRPTFNLGPAAGRVWHTAQLYRAGKARWVIVAGGNPPGQELEQVEAEAIVEMLGVLGVPRDAVRMEGLSRNTRENAHNSLPLVRSVGATRVLLVTSALHMPRALNTFAKAWTGSGIELIPVTTDVEPETPRFLLRPWIPDASSLAFVTRIIKEYAGRIALDML